MKYILSTIIISSILIIVFSIMSEMERSVSSIHAIYYMNGSTLFLLDQQSSFYSIYSFSSESTVMRKAGHFFFYGILTVLIYLAHPTAATLTKATHSVLATTIIGFIDEIHQHFLVNRSGRMLDVFINLSGSLTVVTVAVSFSLASQLILKLSK
ncbi:VanZ family protein [Alkalibacillus haloalkaliphilus]|uniref:VanZ family protein n=1 Tax=Alkalibacillus haloalkaliphilus TaxID=94136 RepID=UPI002936338B|nr:VanZ family protein [Alkalibacillus haloalkaliphilus]MDV2582206.1 VanZ family protein [Alkalibacillus haloalkaliphilus]